MNLLQIFTTINFMLLIMSQAYSWLPITFRIFRRIQREFTGLICGVIGIVFVLRFIKAHGRPPSEQEVFVAIYGEFPESIRREYRMNWLSFFLYQAIIWLSLLLFAS